MDICRTYPKFDADQVLTAEQLNNLFSYLDQQNRWTRKCFVGAGIACGFQVEVNEAERSVIVSEGCGLTTLGYLIKQPLTVCTHYAPYTDPTQYSYFRKDDEQVQLWQLLAEDTFDTEDPDNQRIEVSFLSDKVAILFLEVKDIDLDTCTGSDCDEKGTEVNLCVRILLIEKSRLDQLQQRQADNKLAQLYAQNVNKYALPRLSIGRVKWLGDKEHLLDLPDIHADYESYLSHSKLAEFRNAFSHAYQVYAPLLKESYQRDPFRDWEPELDQRLGIQYFYDHFKDLCLAYHEFIDQAFDVFATCCVPEEAFPKHLMLGCLYEAKKCRPNFYRHYFVTAVQPTHGEQQLKRISTLFERLVILTRAFRIPVLKSGTIKVTPSKEKETTLGMRSIPYYYDTEKFPQLRKVWNFDISDRCLSRDILSYAQNDCRPDCSRDAKPGIFKFNRKVVKEPARYPLSVNLDEYPFYRIEGHLGKDYFEASTEISEWLKCFNLPVKLIGLKAGSVTSGVNLSVGCEFEDINLIYLSQREKITCYFEQTLELVRSIKFDAPQDDLEDSTTSKIVGVFVDGKTGNPLTNVNYSIRKLHLVGKTDHSGKLEFSGIEPGNYMMETYLKGYGSKSFNVSVKHEKTLKLGEIALHRDAHLREIEAYYKDKTSAEEDKRRAASVVFSDRRKLYDNNLEDEEKVVSYKYGSGREKIVTGSRRKESKAASKKTPYTGKADAAVMGTTSPYEIGGILESIGDKQLKDIYASARQYVYEKFANTNVKETDDILDKIYQPLQIANNLTKLIAELEKPLLQFNREYFTGLYEQLLSQVEKFKDIITGDKYGDLFKESDRLDIIRYFNLLRQERCFNQFQSLMDAYEARRLKLQFLHLLSVYSDKNHGMSHVAGAWAGGTFILVYDDHQRVVLDFALPYVCSSDCPPIQFCNGYPVIFKLPREHFCKNDDREFKFITNFPGGEVIGNGVIKNETTGEFFFRPGATDVTPGQNEFSYFLNEARYDYSVVLEDPRVSITYRIINVDSTAKTAEVQFTCEPEEAQEYSWDFGDDTTSSKASPVKVYDLSSLNLYTVSLKVKQGQCYALATHELTFEVCNASFTYREMERSLTTISYQFTHPQAAKDRVWVMGDGNTIEDKENFIHVYELGDVERDISVGLTISQDTCSDSKTETINIPALTKVTIFMDKYAFCRNAAPEKVVFDPKNGTYQGNGLIVKDGEIYFHPGHPSVVLGDNEISYEYQGQRATARVEVSAIEETFRHEIRLIDGNEMFADVQFTAPDNMDSYAFDLGDRNKSTQASFIHRYNIKSSTLFSVKLDLVNGACAVTQTADLDLTPCSAEFSFKYLSNDGESVLVEYTMHETGGKEYHLTDELGTVKSGSRVIQRRYRLGSAERNVRVTMNLIKPPCTNSFTTSVPIATSVPLSLSMDTTQFAWCDKNRYPVEVSGGGTGGVASGPGVRTQGNEIFFVPSLANTGGDVTINYQLGQRRTSLTVKLKKPVASFEIKSVEPVAPNSYDVKVINNSIDSNHAKWAFSPGGEFEGNLTTFRIAPVEAGQPVTVFLTVDWNGQCPDTSPVKTFHIPADSQEIDIEKYIRDIEKLGAVGTFSRIFPPGDAVISKTTGVVRSIQEDFTSPQIISNYRAGKRNKQLSRAFDPIFNATLGQISTKATAISPGAAQSGLPLFEKQMALLLELVSFSSKDFPANDTLNTTFSKVGIGLKKLREQGVNINSRNRLGKLLVTATEQNARKANTVKVLKDMRELLG